ncbi:MAG TPA: PmoA family protein [Bacteroidales bacterium]|nr:PmoA family protein [Bacteroidales bacterium]HPF02385.1 PmoA family protein [Bacteroidales bacterium]HPJ58932.1 PmoA family protein [Bacteroidales bacterium]HPR12186.1 PmoA family protein [Bacteroidales bacterium]HRW84869.1 PmoA family protein [Bacteroidales bacterium]
MRKSLTTILLILAGAIFTLPLQGAKITADKVGSKINVSVNGKFFTSYIFSEDEKYPFFYPVNGPLSGGSVTSMRNAVYPHHSSLFFGCDMVNGGNYWQEGLERGRIISVNARILKQGGDTVIITDECIWSRPGALSPVKDIRTFTITAPSANMTQIDVDITMEMLMDVTIRKTNHSLFSARLAADISVTNGGTMINAEGLQGEKATFGKGSPWIDFYGKRGEATEGLAILQHPSNPWYPSPWFTRDYGFISPTPMYWPENGTDTRMQKGSSLRLRYRVLVHGGTHREADIAGNFEKYRNIK